MKPPSALSSYSDFARRVCIVVGLVILFVLLVWLLGASFDVVLLVLASILIALPLRAGARWLSRRTRWPEGLSVAVVGLSVVGVLVGVGMLVSPLIAEQATELQKELPNVVSNARRQLEGTTWGRQLVGRIPASPEKLLKQGGSGGSQLASRVFGAVTSIVDTFTNVYIIFFLTLFLVAQPRLYVDGLVGLVPQAGRQRTRHILAKLDESLLGWLWGTLLSMTIVGVLSGLGLWLLGVRLAGILALFAGLITFIPNLGPILALIPALLFALLDGPGQALNVFLLYTGIQAVESNVVTPIIQKRLNDVPPALLLVVQIVIGAFAGTLGLAMAAPLLVITMVLVKMIYQEDILGDNPNRS